jgi:uncharacterized protein
VKKPGQRFDAFLPGAHAIDAYGAGGFRFGEMSHIGSILATPQGISAVDVVDLAGLGDAMFQRLFDELTASPRSVEFVVIGVGGKMALLPRAIVEALRSRGLRCEGMATGAALRVYNVMIGEGRRVAALLIAAP